MNSRRQLLQLAALPLLPAAAATPEVPPAIETVSLDGAWDFSFDQQNWRAVNVPHTWQIDPGSTEHYGPAWYRREIFAPAAWSNAAVRIEFEAVFHTAVVSVNGTEAGRHERKGYTAFTIDVSSHLRYGARNTITVRVDNSFNEAMLPRGRSSDWAHDGGIYRPVHLHVTPKTFIESLVVDPDLDLASGSANLNVVARIRNTANRAATVQVSAGVAGTMEFGSRQLEIAANDTAAVNIPATLAKPKLWHFDHPNLYTLRVSLSNGHAAETTFGVRKIEVRGTSFYLNGEKIRPMGVERMAGSNPAYGMAEPPEWIAHDHADMKDLNCVYTRVHWPQDSRTLDWCDRHGILMQTEVPTWGPKTFEGMGNEPSPEIMNNGLEQLREMIARDRNHPCLFSWGVCNEIGGQNPPAYAFAKRMYEEAKRLDPRRLVTYASHSLQKNPGKDVAGLMDYIMWNEYYESWYGNSPDQLSANLDEIHAAFPGKPIVISEYGYCACTADRPEGDGKRIYVLRGHDAIFRDRDYVAGLIFFDYNDYRTHVGDRGIGVLKQRVHGVVDVYGAKKPSWEVLRQESSPVEAMTVTGTPAGVTITIKARASVPAYPMTGYRLRAIAFGHGNVPVEQVEFPQETIRPGEMRKVEFKPKQPGILAMKVDLLRPTGFSAQTATWTP